MFDHVQLGVSSTRLLVQIMSDVHFHATKPESDIYQETPNHPSIHAVACYIGPALFSIPNTDVRLES